jgi:hypothetical protein
LTAGITPSHPSGAVPDHERTPFGQARGFFDRATARRTGTKDTVHVAGNVIVRVKACSISAVGGIATSGPEDDEMMRPFEVVGAPEPPPPPPPPPEPEPTPIDMTIGGGGGGGCAMVATKGGIKELAGAYGALVLVALGLALRRRKVR